MTTWFCTICSHEYEKEGDLGSCYNCGADPKFTDCGFTIKKPE